MQAQGSAARAANGHNPQETPAFYYDKLLNLLQTRKTAYQTAHAWLSAELPNEGKRDTLASQAKAVVVTSINSVTDASDRNYRLSLLGKWTSWSASCEPPFPAFPVMAPLAILFVHDMALDPKAKSTFTPTPQTDAIPYAWTTKQRRKALFSVKEFSKTAAASVYSFLEKGTYTGDISSSWAAKGFLGNGKRPERGLDLVQPTGSQAPQKVSQKRKASVEPPSKGLQLASDEQAIHSAPLDHPLGKRQKTTQAPKTPSSILRGADADSAHPDRLAPPPTLATTSDISSAPKSASQVAPSATILDSITRPASEGRSRTNTPLAEAKIIAQPQQASRKRNADGNLKTPQIAVNRASPSVPIDQSNAESAKNASSPMAAAITKGPEADLAVTTTSAPLAPSTRVHANSVASRAGRRNSMNAEFASVVTSLPLPDSSHISSVQSTPSSDAEPTAFIAPGLGDKTSKGAIAKSLTRKKLNLVPESDVSEDDDAVILNTAMNVDPPRVTLSPFSPVATFCLPVAKQPAINEDVDNMLAPADVPTPRIPSQDQSPQENATVSAVDGRMEPEGARPSASRVGVQVSTEPASGTAESINSESVTTSAGAAVTEASKSPLPVPRRSPSPATHEQTHHREKAVVSANVQNEVTRSATSNPPPARLKDLLGTGNASIDQFVYGHPIPKSPPKVSASSPQQHKRTPSLPISEAAQSKQAQSSIRNIPEPITVSTQAMVQGSRPVSTEQSSDTAGPSLPKAVASGITSTTSDLSVTSARVLASQSPRSLKRSPRRSLVMPDSEDESTTTASKKDSGAKLRAISPKTLSIPEFVTTVPTPTRPDLSLSARQSTATGQDPSASALLQPGRAASPRRRSTSASSCASETARALGSLDDLLDEFDELDQEQDAPPLYLELPRIRNLPAMRTYLPRAEPAEPLSGKCIVETKDSLRFPLYMRAPIVNSYTIYPTFTLINSPSALEPADTTYLMPRFAVRRDIKVATMTAHPRPREPCKCGPCKKIRSKVIASLPKASVSTLAGSTAGDMDKSTGAPAIIPSVGNARPQGPPMPALPSAPTQTTARVRTVSGNSEASAIGLRDYVHPASRNAAPLSMSSERAILSQPSLQSDAQSKRQLQNHPDSSVPQSKKLQDSTQRPVAPQVTDEATVMHAGAGAQTIERSDKSHLEASTGHRQAQVHAQANLRPRMQAQSELQPYEAGMRPQQQQQPSLPQIQQAQQTLASQPAQIPSQLNSQLQPQLQTQASSMQQQDHSHARRNAQRSTATTAAQPLQRVVSDPSRNARASAMQSSLGPASITTIRVPPPTFTPHMIENEPIEVLVDLFAHTAWLQMHNLTNNTAESEGNLSPDTRLHRALFKGALDQMVNPDIAGIVFVVDLVVCRENVFSSSLKDSAQKHFTSALPVHAQSTLAQYVNEAAKLIPTSREWLVKTIISSSTHLTAFYTALVRGWFPLQQGSIHSFWPDMRLPDANVEQLLRDCYAKELAWKPHLAQSQQAQSQNAAPLNRSIQIVPRAGEAQASGSPGNSVPSSPAQRPASIPVQANAAISACLACLLSAQSCVFENYARCVNCTRKGDAICVKLASLPLEGRQAFLFSLQQQRQVLAAQALQTPQPAPPQQQAQNQMRASHPWRTTNSSEIAKSSASTHAANTASVPDRLSQHMDTTQASAFAGAIVDPALVNQSPSANSKASPKQNSTPKKPAPVVGVTVDAPLTVAKSKDSLPTSRNITPPNSASKTRKSRSPGKAAEDDVEVNGVLNVVASPQKSAVDLTQESLSKIDDSETPLPQNHEQSVSAPRSNAAQAIRRSGRATSVASNASGSSNGSRRHSSNSNLQRRARPSVAPTAPAPLNRTHANLASTPFSMFGEI